ncbi:MAG: flagellar motor switch protein FliN [Deltaproteobacteria bacterium]|nr:flagellar motor switch protein FliN [Deltaproteobacteria bacterium]
MEEEKEDSQVSASEEQQDSASNDPEEGASQEAATPDDGPPKSGEPDVDQVESDGTRDLEFILDIPLEISVELGRTRMLVNDLLRLGQGSIVELSKLADEPMDIYVNRKLFARGEVVVVNEKFGIRLTDIISPAERVKSLG